MLAKAATELENEIERLGRSEIVQRRAELENLVRTHRNSFVRAAAVQALAESPRPSLPVLRRAIRDARDQMVQIEIAEALGQAKDKNAVPVLRKLAATRRRPLVRAASIDALGQIGSRSQLSFLRRITAGERNALVRASMFAALHRLGDASSLERLIAALEHRSYLVRIRAANLLSELKDARARLRVRHALGNALRAEKVPTVRSSLRKALAQSGR